MYDIFLSSELTTIFNFCYNYLFRKDFLKLSLKKFTFYSQKLHEITFYVYVCSFPCTFNPCVLEGVVVQNAIYFSLLNTIFICVEVCYLFISPF